MKAFEYVTAQSFDAATAFLAGEGLKDTLVKAGGIDVVDRLKERIAQPARVLNLRTLAPKSAGIELRNDKKVIAIDALTTLAEIAESPEIRARLPALAAAAGEAASPQIRGVATLGGNLCQKPRCWYFRSADFQCLKKGGGTCYAVQGDNRYHAIFAAGACHIVHPSSAAVPLMAYCASVRLVKSENGRPAERTVALDEFFRVPPNPQDDENTLAPGELIREVLVPLDCAGARSAFVEIREKQAFDWPLVMCAAAFNNPRQVRVVLGAVAPIPWRLKKVEGLLTDIELSDGLIAKVAGAARDGAQPMSGNAYKIELVSAAVEDTLRQVMQAK
jgi:xanthine dehydrogenase YagS FAD-binding subunit